MKKVCIEDCFIPEVRGFKKGEIVEDKKMLDLIKDSPYFITDFKETKIKDKKEGGK